MSQPQPQFQSNISPTVSHTMGLCGRCRRRRIAHKEKYCQRCLILMSRSGEVPKDVKSMMCFRCGRRESVDDYPFCERCLILEERETGKKPLSLKETLEQARKVEEKKQERILCKKCGRRDPVENSDYCERCTILMAREIRK